MDKKDLQILRLLGENCRLQNVTLAKVLNVSKDTVKNRIKALEEKNIITHYNTIIDLRTLGFSKFQFLIKLKNASQDKETLIESLKKHESLSFVNTFIGKYDLHIIADTKDIYSFGKIKSEIFSLLQDKIQDFTLLTFFSDIKHTNLIPETTLEIKFEKKADTSFSSFFTQSYEVKKDFSPYNPDSIDIEILKTLALNPKMSLVDLAENLKLNREAIKQRIIKLISKKIIKNFGANTSFEAFDYITYFLIIKTNTEIQEKSLQDKFRQIKNIFYSAKVHGDYSLITYILAKTPNELKETIRKIQEALENQILETEIMIFDEIKLYKQLPKRVLEELEAKT